MANVLWSEGDERNENAKNRTLSATDSNNGQREEEQQKQIFKKGGKSASHSD